MADLDPLRGNLVLLEIIFRLELNLFRGVTFERDKKSRLLSVNLDILGAVVLADAAAERYEQAEQARQKQWPIAGSFPKELNRLGSHSLQPGPEAGHGREEGERSDQNVDRILERFEFAQVPGGLSAAVELAQGKRLGQFRLAHTQPHIFRRPQDGDKDPKFHNPFHI